MNWKQLKKIKFKDVVNPYKWLSFIRGNSNVGTLPLHELEQIIYRVNKCAECLERGYCDHCGCSMPAKAYDPNSVCDNEETGERWGPMFGKEAWEQYKKDFKIDIGIIFNI